MDWLIENQDLFPRQHLDDIKESLDRMSENNQFYIKTQSYHNPKSMIIISIIFGWFGIDRLLIGQMGVGILKLITLGGLGIWAIIDWFKIKEATRVENLKLMVPFLK